jgi:hypothetical protein
MAFVGRTVMGSGVKNQVSDKATLPPRPLPVNPEARKAGRATNGNPHEYPTRLELTRHELKTELILRAKGEIRRINPVKSRGPFLTIQEATCFPSE